MHFSFDAFYSVRAYDAEKGGRPVDSAHVVIRARVESDIEKVKGATTGWFDLPHGSDYRYHLAVPESELARFLSDMVSALPDRAPMKTYDSPRSEVHHQVWTAAMGLKELDLDNPASTMGEIG